MGALQNLAELDAREATAAQAAVATPSDAAPPLSEVRVDGAAIGTSLLLLALLLGIAFERVLGLDRVINKFLLEWKERREYDRRNETIDARSKFERQFSSDEDNGEDNPNKT